MEIDVDLAFIHKVQAYIATQGFKALYMGQIWSECVMVLDTMNECDIYFSPERYEPTMPEIWRDGAALFPGRTKEFGLGILPGTGRTPSIKNLDEARQFALQYLRQKQ